MEQKNLLDAVLGQDLKEKPASYVVGSGLLYGSTVGNPGG